MIRDNIIPRNRLMAYVKRANIVTEKDDSHVNY